MPVTDSHTILALTAIALWTKGVVLSLAQVAIRVRTRRYARAEDARMMRQSVQPEDPRIERLSRAWRNELEATPAFLSLAVVHVLTGGSAMPFAAICLIFVAGRYVQGFAQYRLAQPQRTIGFLLGLGASFAMVPLVLWRICGAAA